MRSVYLVLALLVPSPTLAASPRSQPTATALRSGAGRVSPPSWRVLLGRLRLRLAPHRAAPLRPEPLATYRRGDVYLDYPFEDVKFRYENRTGKVYRRFNGQAEVEVSLTSGLFRDAMSAGRRITHEEYHGPALAPPR